MKSLQRIAALGALLVFAAVQTVFAAPEAAGATAQEAAATTRTVATTTIPSDGNEKAHPQWFAACEKRVAEMKGKPCNAIFIGDSITENFINRPSPSWDLVGRDVWDKHYAGRNILDFGVGADRTQDVLWRLENMDVKAFDPKVAVVMIGTNNTRDTPEAIAAGVEAVVKKTQATFKHAKIILISILPSARAAQKMADANAIIAKFGDDKAVFYFDLASKMTPENGSWKGLGRDKLHLTSDGYELWASSMEPLLSKLLAER